MGIQILNVSFWDAVRFAINDLVLAAVMFSFLERMYLRKYSSNIVYFSSYASMVIISTFIACFGNTIVNGVCSFILICIWAMLLYKCNIKQYMFHGFCYMLMALFADVIGTAVSSAISSSTIKETLGRQLSMYISSMINWILLLLFYKVLITILKKEKRNIINFKELVFFVCLTFLEVSITAYIIGLIKGISSGIMLALYLVCFFALNMYITYLIHKTASVSQLKYELKLSRQQVDMQLRHYQELIINQEKSRKIIHDAKNHVLAVESLFLNSNNDKGEEYTRILCNKLDELTYDFKCSNTILGIIVSSKLQEAEEKQIKMTPTIEDVSIDFMDDFDITGIFANLLNNSFEECYNLPCDLKWVNLTVRRINDFLVINVANPTKAIPEPMKNIYKTSKSGHEGIGLSIVLATVEKYHGSFIAEVVEGNFVVKITIPI